MTRRFVIVGTDTGVGKTIFSAALVQALGASYWKPVQAGLDEETDSQTVARLSGAPRERILPEAWRLRLAASPHIAARAEGVEIDAASLTPPDVAGPLVIETAGGVMVPLTDEILTIDVLARWRLPVILVARTRLGAINHSLLTIEVLRHRAIAIHGVAFVGEEEREAQETILRIGKVKALGRLPRLAVLSKETLRTAFDAAFSRTDFE
ncbi:dethiobiotin synthase [Methylocystis sp. MJC1]|jgi:dethiobiotin synthetase|uniref:dethiobiotin synthase n=1 Tax=Methylocystis sp. MJC1 TaxID=2654282 RepID=UPI0013EC7162|nr:dethiobiotin synthase [Methylocystis sp. MJC1]KAF2990667.1 ATP-dependent dethiobiotin synthetase BioD 1 [Methylocystis sp. MJC1]MBU6528732.1 ATP-dependent dethiobiotin synthetase BioD [Methylocystis sp. MJC1]UZX11620.1 dethiobiotin synthase [Methylocystis sp. MJC1]